MVDALPERLDRLEGLMPARPRPVLVQLRPVGSRPLDDEPPGPRRELAGDDLAPCTSAPGRAQYLALTSQAPIVGPALPLPRAPRRNPGPERRRLTSLPRGKEQRPDPPMVTAAGRPKRHRPSPADSPCTERSPACRIA